MVLAAKLRQDAEDPAANCRPHGTPDWPRLATDIEEDLELARRQRPAAAVLCRRLSIRRPLFRLILQPPPGRRDYGGLLEEPEAKRPRRGGRR